MRICSYFIIFLLFLSSIFIKLGKKKESKRVEKQITTTEKKMDRYKKKWQKTDQNRPKTFNLTSRTPVCVCACVCVCEGGRGGGGWGIWERVVKNLVSNFKSVSLFILFSLTYLLCYFNIFIWGYCVY